MPSIDSKRLIEWQRCLLNEQLQPLRRGWRKPPVLLGTWITRNSEDLFDIQLLGRPALTFYQQELKPYYENQSWGRKFVLWWKRLDSGFRQKERLWAYARNYLAYQEELKSLSSTDPFVYAERFKLQRIVLSKKQSMWRTSYVPEKKPNNPPMTEKALVKIQQEASKKVTQWLSPLFKSHKQILDAMAIDTKMTLQDYETKEKELAKIRHIHYLTERDKWTAQWKQINQKFQFEGDCFLAFRDQETAFKKTLLRPNVKATIKVSDEQITQENGKLETASSSPQSSIQNALVIVSNNPLQAIPLEKTVSQYLDEKIPFETVTQNALDQLAVIGLTDTQIIGILEKYTQTIENQLSDLVNRGKALIGTAIDQGTLYADKMLKDIDEIEQRSKEIYKKMVLVLHADKHVTWKTMKIVLDKANELFASALNLFTRKTEELREAVSNPGQFLDSNSPNYSKQLENVQKGRSAWFYQEFEKMLNKMQEETQENRKGFELWLATTLQKSELSFHTNLEERLQSKVAELEEAHKKELQKERAEYERMLAKKLKENESNLRTLVKQELENYKQELVDSLTPKQAGAVEQIQDKPPNNQGALDSKKENTDVFYNTNGYEQYGFHYSSKQPVVIQPEGESKNWVDKKLIHIPQ